MISVIHHTEHRVCGFPNLSALVAVLQQRDNMTLTTMKTDITFTKIDYLSHTSFSSLLLFVKEQCDEWKPMTAWKEGKTHFGKWLAVME